MVGTGPRGRIVRSMRVVGEDDGAELRVSGAGVIVHLRPTSESRRTFDRFCRRNAVVATPVAWSGTDGTFNRRTGERVRESEAVPDVYQVVGPVAALRALCSHPVVRDWHFAVDVRVPFVAGGSGELSERGRRGLREARREVGERAAACERAAVREHAPPDPDTAAVKNLAGQLGVSPDDADTLSLLAELLRYARQGEGNLTTSERTRAAVLCGRLGL